LTRKSTNPLEDEDAEAGAPDYGTRAGTAHDAFLATHQFVLEFDGPFLVGTKGELSC
jgi:hypothetical protein